MAEVECHDLESEHVYHDNICLSCYTVVSFDNWEIGETIKEGCPPDQYGKLKISTVEIFEYNLLPTFDRRPEILYCPLVAMTDTNFISCALFDFTTVA